MGTRLSATVATAFAVLAFGLGIRVAAMAGPSEQTVGIPEWRICLTLPMFAGAVALFIVMIVRLQQLRKRHSLRAWRSLSRTERQYASRQFRGKSSIGESIARWCCNMPRVRCLPAARSCRRTEFSG